MSKIYKTKTIIVLSILWFIFAIAVNAVMVKIASTSLLDFGSFIASGINLSNGTNPYDSSSELIFKIFFPEVNTGGKLPNLNPPITLFLFRPLANTDFLQMTNIWRFLAVAIYIISVFILVRNHKHLSILKLLWIFSLAGFWHTIELGQIYTPLLLLVVLAWIYSLNKKYVLAGILLGLLASIKPNFVIWIAILFASRNWRMALSAIFMFTIVGTIPLFLLGPNVYSQWLAATQVETEILAMPGNSSLIGLTSRMGAAQIGLAIATLLLGVVSFLLFRLPRNIVSKDRTVNEFGIILSLLASPISWVGYTIFLLPLFVVRKKWPPLLTIAALILSIPFIVTLRFYETSHFNFIVWGWIYGFAITICLYFVARALTQNLYAGPDVLSQTTS